MYNFVENWLWWFVSTTKRRLQISNRSMNRYRPNIFKIKTNFLVFFAFNNCGWTKKKEKKREKRKKFLTKFRSPQTNIVIFTSPSLSLQQRQKRTPSFFFLIWFLTVFLWYSSFFFFFFVNFKLSPLQFLHLHIHSHCFSSSTFL